jgi:hypothetical protein
MQQMFVMLKRKPGISQAEFRQHYETSHIPLCSEVFDGLIVRFSRYFVKSAIPFPGQWSERENSCDAPAYDALSFYTFRDAAAFTEYERRMADTGTSKRLREDEDKFLDREFCKFGFCEGLSGEGLIVG